MVIVSSGATHGIRQTFPFVSGAVIGFTLLLLFVGLGFYKFVNTYPFFLNYVGIAGSMFIIYMGYMIATSKPEIEIEERKRPTFPQGFLMQWLNPKAWLASMAGVSIFSTPDSNLLFLKFSLVYFVVCYLSLFAWSVLGDKVTILLNSESRIGYFNKVMGGLLVLTACFLLYSQFS